MTFITRLHSQKSTGPFQAIKWKQAVTGPWTDPYQAGCSPPTSPCTSCVQDVSPRPVYSPWIRGHIRAKRPRPVYRLTTVELEARNGRHLTTKTELRQSCKMEKKPCCVSQEGLLVQKDSLKRTIIIIQSILPVGRKRWAACYKLFNKYIEISHSSLYL